jgi:hypothetical protein
VIILFCTLTVCFLSGLIWGHLCLVCYGVQVFQSVDFRASMLFGRLGSGKLRIENMWLLSLNMWFLLHMTTAVFTRYVILDRKYVVANFK